MWNSFFSINTRYISKVQQRDKRINRKQWPVKQSKIFGNQKAVELSKWQKYNPQHDPASFQETLNFFMIWQQKSNTKHIFTMHQILRKIHKTCTTYMQVLDLKERVALDLMDGFLSRQVGPKLCILPEMQSRRSWTWDRTLSKEFHVGPQFKCQVLF